MSAAELFLTDGGGNPVWTLTDVVTPATASGPPASVVASATGGTTLNVVWAIGSGGVPDLFDVELETPTGSANWVAAIGASNPVLGSVFAFPASSLSPITSYTPRVRSKKSGFADSAWAVGAPVTTDNSAIGGAVISAVDVTAPTLAGEISITGLGSTGYTATCPPASDAVGVFGYQWRLGGVGVWTDIPSGGRSRTFTGRTPATTDSLEMRARDVAGNFSAALLSAVTLSGIAPTVVTHPSNLSIAAGATATFVAVFNGTPTPTVQWFRNGSAVSGATSLTYSFVPSLGDSGSVYVCQATNGVGPSVGTNAAILTVTASAVAPSIATQPASQTVNEGNPVTFNVAANGSTPLAFQWRRGGTSISGAVGSSYSLTPTTADGGATFSVVVTNGAGSVTSSAATLSVVAPGSTNPFGLVHTIYFPDTAGPRDTLRLERSRGDTFVDEFHIKSADTLLPINITGCSFLMTVDPEQAPGSSANNVYQLTAAIVDAPGGRIGFAPSAIQADLVGGYYFDIQMLDASGRKRTLKYGSIVYTQDITK